MLVYPYHERIHIEIDSWLPLILSRLILRLGGNCIVDFHIISWLRPIRLLVKIIILRFVKILSALFSLKITYLTPGTHLF